MSGSRESHAPAAARHQYPNLTVTFLLEFNSRFLLIHRSAREANYPTKWAFPGGKAELTATGTAETAVDTIRREVAEETGLPLTGECAFLDTFSFQTTTGIAFLLKVRHDRVRPRGFTEYKWVAAIEELRGLDCIAGIYNHLVEAQKALRRGDLRQLDEIQLTPDTYLNK